NILTFLVHGSGPKKELDSRKINKSNQDLSRMLEEKLGSRGFENQYRLVLAGGNEEGTYGLAERFMDIMCMDTAKKTNFFVFEKLQSKLSTNFKNDIILANIDKLSVDILNEKEIVRVIEHLI
ncbi:MAG: hypothetical protein PHS44_06985, partial [Candidatus Dojkabacteria bacterium]|nr:hypothetical protein [Candidatus Dojkabacteria bacterium]